MTETIKYNRWKSIIDLLSGKYKKSDTDANSANQTKRTRQFETIQSLELNLQNGKVYISNKYPSKLSIHQTFLQGIVFVQINGSLLDLIAQVGISLLDDDNKTSEVIKKCFRKITIT